MKTRMLNLPENNHENDPRYEALRELEREAFELEQKIMFSRGRIIVIVTAVFIALSSVADIFVSFVNFNGLSLLGSVVNIIFVIALIKRTAWARYFFIVTLVLSALVTFVAIGSISPNLSYSSVQVKMNSETGEFYGVPLDMPLAELSDGGAVTPLYVVLSVLLAVYIAGAGLLAFSKSVRLYFKFQKNP